MPSGKRSRESRKRPAAASARSRRASPRVLFAGAAGVVAVAVAIVLAVVFTGGSSKVPANTPVVGSLANGVPGAADVERLFKGVPQRGMTLGAASAPVTIVEYVDVQCPFCRQFETDVLPGLVRSYVRTGKLKIVLRAWAFIGPDSVRGQAAVLAAGAQNRAFNYAELLFDHQGVENSGWLGDDLVAAVAASIPGLRVHRLLDERSSALVKSQAGDVDRLAHESGITSTPTFVVGKSGTPGKRVVLKSATDRQTLVRAIETALS
jgi:protein-disulfide isomerase